MMSHLTAAQQALLREVQDCATALRRWLAIDSNSAALMAYLRDEPVDRTWLATSQLFHRGLARCVGDDQRGGGLRTAFGGTTRPCRRADTGSR